MRLTEEDVVCCPPPLFHCFGLVLGFLASLVHGSAIIFPSEAFHAERTVQAIIQERATALLGVPTMFLAELKLIHENGLQIDSVRTGLAAGATIPPSLMKLLSEKMGIKGMLVAYGMTETSPVTFITSFDDPQDKMQNSIGKVLPHTAAKVIDEEGQILPRNKKGELCTAGFALQKGYWKEPVKTQEVMRLDDNGVLWMHTGDEAYIDEKGYGHITGRIKDIIIRGMYNVSSTCISIIAWLIRLHQRRGKYLAGRGRKPPAESSFHR